MASLIRNIALGILFISLGNQLAAQKKWQPDSTSLGIPGNISLYGPAVHPGVYAGFEIPFRKRIKHKEARKLLVKMGLRDSFSHKIIRSHLVFEPGLGLYNHRFNHMGIYFGGNLFYRRTFHSGLFLDIGAELGRLNYIYRDVIEFDERNNPVERNFASKGYNQLGLNASVGVNLNSRTALFYRYHIGTLLPYNHALISYRRHEIGIRLKGTK